MTRAALRRAITLTQRSAADRKRFEMFRKFMQWGSVPVLEMGVEENGDYVATIIASRFHACALVATVALAVAWCMHLGVLW